MHLPDLIRYGAWAGIVVTAEANRRHYQMTTTWLPHLVMNTVTLLLPDLHRLLVRADGRRGRDAEDRPTGWAQLGADTLAALVRDNPAYVAYVLPLAAGYLLSNPRYTIYKGRAAELRLFGFGLDALPHTTTAFALTALVGDALRVAAERGGGRYGALVAARRHEAALTALALAAATLVWELGEYRIHQHELARRGSAEAINMQWSPEDALYDCLSNALGWAAATVWHRSRV